MVSILSELDDCFNKGLIRKIPPSKEKALRSLNKADRWLEEARRSLSFNLFNSCLVASYSAMFHASRALLFKDGFREKSHYCLARYLEEMYVNTGRLNRVVVDLLDRFRTLRHEDLYELDFSATREDAEEAVRNAEMIVKEMKSLVLG